MYGRTGVTLTHDSHTQKYIFYIFFRIRYDMVPPPPKTVFINIFSYA